MRLKAKTLLYWKGHFVAEGQEFEAEQVAALRLVESGIATEVSGGRGSQHQVIDLNGQPAPVADLRPKTDAPAEPAPRRRKKTETK